MKSIFTNYEFTFYAQRVLTSHTWEIYLASICFGNLIQNTITLMRQSSRSEQIFQWLEFKLIISIWWIFKLSFFKKYVLLRIVYIWKHVLFYSAYYFLAWNLSKFQISLTFKLPLGVLYCRFQKRRNLELLLMWFSLLNILAGKMHDQKELYRWRFSE